MKQKGKAFEGFETFFNSLRMSLKMHLIVISCCFLFYISIVSIVSYFTIDKYAFKVLSIYSLAYGITSIVPDFIHPALNYPNPDGTFRKVAASTIVNYDPVIKYVNYNMSEISRIFKWSLLVTLIYPLAWYFFWWRSQKLANNSYIRGAKLITPEEIKKEFKRRNEELNLPLGSIKMPVSLENRHTLIIGKPGVGKTQCFRPVLRQWQKMGRKGICYDNKGEYFSEFYNPETDLLFNPLDQRSMGWNLFNELISYPDVDAVAASLIPPPISTSDPFWNDAARGVFSGILHYLYQNDCKNNNALWNILSSDAKDIADKLKNTKGGEAGHRYITQNAESSRQAESVLSVMMQYTKCFEYMANTEGDFKINDWLYNRNGIIFITNYEDIEETLKPVLSLFVDLIGRKILSMPDDINRRILIGLDEFGSLQRLSTIVKLLTRGRSKGACIFLGIQDDGQTEKIYTPHIRKSIDNACGNRITFALTGETAEKEARYNIGDTEFIEHRRTTSMGPHDMRDGISLNEQKKRELMLLSSEISNLPDLQAIVRLKNYDFVMSNWNWEPTQQKYDPFILREDLLLENILSEQAAIKSYADENVFSLNIEPRN